MNLSQQINALLPQTQCQKCGYSGCQPYAEAIAHNQADINLCTTGQYEVLEDLARLLNKESVTQSYKHHQIAIIDEETCIGCTACIRACPVDAIIGSNKLMHTIITNECTGCALCIPPCPVDCITLFSVEDPYLPRNHFLSQNTLPRFAAAEHAKLRYHNHMERKNKQLSPRKNPVSLATKANQAPLQNIQALLTKAKSKAQDNIKHGRTTIQSKELEQKRLQTAQDKAAYRNAQRKFRYGTKTEKQEAIVFLRNYRLNHNEEN